MKIPGNQSHIVCQNQTGARLRFSFHSVIFGWLMLLATAGKLRASDVFVPNFSFESQATQFVDTRIDSWQKPAQPNTFDTNVFGAWDNLSGLFANTPSTNGDFIDNADGGQLAFLFAYPQIAIFQDFNSTDWSNGAPTHAFNATFNPGKSYRLTVGLTTSSEEPLNQGSTIQLSVYYRDISNNMVTVAATTVTYDTNVFTNLTHLIDFHVNVPMVQTNDAWAGQHIGIQIMSTTAPQLIGGVWDVDNVRLTELVGVPNFSFESQATQFVDTRIDSWQKPAQPNTFDTNVFGSWDNLAGLFANTPSTNGDFIDNAEGGQLAFLFAYPQIAIFQDFNSTDWSNGAPTHAFNATFTAGKAYDLTVGLTTSSEEPLTIGSTLLLNLYYRDASNNMVTVGATTVTFDTNVFTNFAHLVDFKVKVPTVKPTDAWAGKNIGIQFEATTAPQLIGGVWDLDNVRLNETGVPNYSFESQPTDFVDTRIDSWQKPPQPDTFDTNVFGAWDNLAGLFANAPSTNGDFIDNADGSQVAFLFAYPQIGIFQDVNSTDWSNGVPTHAFNLKFKPGKSYSLTVALTTSKEEPLTSGSTLQLSLYYRDATNNMVTVAANNVTFTTNVFTNFTHLVDFQTAVPEVKPTDAWAGKNIGIAIQATTAPQFIGGVWDLDNVRLVEFVPTALNQPRISAQGFKFTLQSEPGLRFEILAANSLNPPATNWTGIATVTNAVGTVSFVDTNANLNEHFYRAQQLP